MPAGEMDLGELVAGPENVALGELATWALGKSMGPWGRLGRTTAMKLGRNEQRFLGDMRAFGGERPSGWAPTWETYKWSRVRLRLLEKRCIEPYTYRDRFGEPVRSVIRLTPRGYREIEKRMVLDQPGASSGAGR